LIWHRRMPVRSCSNCGAPVCRRCAHRQREVALCRTCAKLAARVEADEFGRVLLFQQKRKVERLRGVAGTVLATLVPGLGLIGSRRIFYAICLLMIASVLATIALMVRAPFPLGEDVLDLQSGKGLAIAWLVLYLLSIVGFLGRKSEPEAPAKSGSGRVTVPEPPARAA